MKKSRTEFVPCSIYSTIVAATAFVLLLSGCETNDTPAVATQGTAPSATGSTGAQAETTWPTSLTLGSRSPQPTGPAPTITAKAAILISQSGRVLFEKNADTRLAAASTQKLLLGIMVAERGNLGQVITIEEPDTWAEPTIMGIKPGQTYTRAELLRAVLVRSSNDIARALARDHSGSVSAFAGAMNVRARQLGMYNSYFTNASGLPKPPGQYSTARDLARLGQAALRISFVRDSVATKGMVFRFSNGSTKTLSNTNQVLRHFPYCNGLKTGYTNAAGRCLVSSATANGNTVIAVILGSKTPTVWEESEALLRYGLGL
ncbi:MAG: D-alanyl-D-alanine carboxypeptidase family protein [Verrucomicrobiota bacterium]